MKLLNKKVVYKEEVKQKKSRSGIILTDESKPAIIEGVVVDADPQTVFKKGQHIMVNWYNSDKIDWEGEECSLISEEHIIAYGK